MIPFCFYCADRDELFMFKSSITTYLRRLRQLHFVLYLPVETIIEKNDLYWFDLDHRAVQNEIDNNGKNTVMLLYTVPYLLSNQRQLHNHTFARRSQTSGKINHIQWIVDCAPLSINTTLTHLRHVHWLQWFYDIQVCDMHIFIDILNHLTYLGNNSKSTFVVPGASSLA